MVSSNLLSSDNSLTDVVGYKSYVDVADQITGYAEADIPLETMWYVYASCYLLMINTMIGPTLTTFADFPVLLKF